MFLVALPTSFGQTLYSYQSGNWDSFYTWTTDPSGTLWVNSGFLTPTVTNAAVILNGRTVNTVGNNRLSASLEIREGGVLDLGNSNNHNFGTVSGKGSLKLSTYTFPGGDYTAFVSAQGGTIEYYDLNNTRISIVQLTYNNLIISNNTDNANSVYLDNSTNPVNYVVNGSLIFKNNSTGSLTFRIGNPTASDNKINMSVYGNIIVGAGCSITVNNFATEQSYNNVHNLNIYGDFLNNGSVRFTGLPSPVINNYYTLTSTRYSGTNYGAVKVTFAGATNNTLTCNGTTDFYRFIVDKGSDQTYMLEVISSNVSNFAVYGPNNMGGHVFSPPDPNKAVFLANGTLKLNDNINIPSLSEEGQDFNIPATSALWINGATVSTTVSGFNGTGYQAATIIGRLRISSGSFTTGDAAGIVLGPIATPEIIVEGTGVLSASQVWSGTGGGNKMSFIQTGGTVNIRLQGEEHSGWYMLNLHNPNTVFTMTGGTLNFLNNTFINGNLCTQIFNIQSAAGNYHVSGGTVNINVPGNNIYDITSTVPFYNLNISRQSGSNQATIRSATNFNIINDFTLNANTALDAATNNINLSIGNNFIMDTTSAYNCGNNTTIFNGSSGQRFINAGTISGGNGLNHLTITNNSNTDIFSKDIIIRGNLTIDENCYLNDFGNLINVAGIITNSGTHTSQANGGILLNSTGNQTIGGSGNGVFGNLIINKANGVASLTADQNLGGNLRLASGVLDISSYNLSLGENSSVYDALTGSTSLFSGTKMILTSGNVSDGGVTKKYNNVNPQFLFPLGTGSDYTPVTIEFSKPLTAYGDITVKPVKSYQPFVSSTNSLYYYWKVTSSGFTHIPSGAVRHVYQYVNDDWNGRGNIVSYIPAVYDGLKWTSINDIAQVVDANNEIYFTDVDYLEGDFTAGQNDALAPVLTYYSRKSGSWSDGETWSTDSALKWNGAPAGSYPGTSNPVIIGDGISHNDTIIINSNDMRAGALQISGKSILDLGVSTGHNFGSIIDSKSVGFGKLRISSAIATAAFPAGDFGLFLGSDGGTVEYYSSGADFTLPLLDHYRYLITSPSIGRIITMPNIDLIVLGNLKVSGSGVTLLNSAAPRVLSIYDSLIVSSGILRYRNIQAQTLKIGKDVIIGVSGRFDVANAGATVLNTLSIAGSLTNNGIFDMYTDNFHYCDVIFSGIGNEVIDGTGTITDFNRLTINKGSSRNAVIDVTSSAFSLGNSSLATSLFIQNGTFRLTSPLSITLSTLGSFTIPATGCLSANGGTINIALSVSNYDLLLAGRLEVLAGAVNIGAASNDNNNDIEYSSAGSPEIIVKGGNLFVNGQIRRNIINTLGSLVFNQSGGTITINGRNQVAGRAKFEITNGGSSFTTSGGNLIIVRSGGTTYSDVYINPEYNKVTGGTIQVGSASSPAGQLFTLNSAIPLWNLTVDGTTNIKTLSLQINNLKLQDSLFIRGNSIFMANGLSVNIGGSLINQNTSNAVGVTSGGYQPGSINQLTTFNGSANNQTITGIAGNLTNFAKVEINNTFIPGRISLNSNTNIRINSDLKLSHGILNDGGNTITVNGNISNSAIHESPSGNGIVLTNSARQVISGNGNGQFGNLILDNSNDIFVVDNATINNLLTFINGNLYIDDYLLTFGENASVSGAASSGMIISNGVISDFGVRKNYPASPSAFTFPIGVSGKYTPVTINLTANNTAGSVTVKPVNREHPSLQDVSGNELRYYWSVTSAGFGTITANHDYNYMPADAGGDESAYRCGRFFNDNWNPINGIAGAVDAGSHQIGLNVPYIDGEYTAGAEANFSSVDTYYSITSGNWEVPGTWSTEGPSGAPATGTPNGHKVIIAAKDTVTITSDSKKAQSLILNGTLEVSTTTCHNLGYVTGNGTVRLTNTSNGFFVFPGGNYDSFMNQSQSLVIYTGNTAATLPANIGTIYKPYQNVIFRGNAIKNLPAINMKVRGNLNINQGVLSNANANKNIHVLGVWNNNVVSGFNPGTGLVSFEGTTAQQLNALATEQFYDLQINNRAGVTLNNHTNVSNKLLLTNGNLNSSASSLLTITNKSTDAVTGGGDSSFVNGPLAKAISGGSYFDFPVGKTGRFGKININNTSTGVRTWKAEYFNSDPVAAGMAPSSMQLPIDSVSNNEYWQINGGVSNIQANVRARWDKLSGIIPFDSLTRLYKVRIVEWNGSMWQTRGSIVTDGGVLNGTVETSAPVELNNDHFFTLGLERRPTATITGGNASICNNGADVNVAIALTGVSPWTIQYRINGANETTVTNIGTSPFNIVTNYTNLASLGGGPDYTYTISSVSDAFGVIGINNFVPDAKITLLDSPVPVISGKTSVCKNETGVVYYTPNLPDHTYTWAIVGGTITSGQGTYQVRVNWGSGSSGSVSVTETNSLTGCSVSAIKNINITNGPTPVVTGKKSVCLNSEEGYYTAPALDHTFLWTVNGGTILNGQGTDSITVHWNSTGPGTVSVLETVKATGASVVDTLDISVRGLPGADFAVIDTTVICGDTVTIVLQGGESSTDYALRLHSDSTVVSTVHNVMAGDVIFKILPTESTIYNISVTNEYGCNLQLGDLSEVFVVPPAIGTIQYDLILIRRNLKN